MKSPFPGMDPYLEHFWGDVHSSLIIYARDQLRSQLPSDLRVRVEEQISVQEAGEKEQVFYPDVRVVERPKRGSAAPADTDSSVALAEPLIIPVEFEPRTERSIRIIDAHSGNRVVTAIEFLSPANKVTPAGRTAYRKKQRDLLDGGVNLVEIDLLHCGEYVLAAKEEHIPFDHLTPYKACVIRAWAGGRAEFYRLPLRNRLSRIRIPLRETDADVGLDLQQLIEQSYENGGYGDDIDYRTDLHPPLSPIDTQWAEQILKEKGRR